METPNIYPEDVANVGALEIVPGDIIAQGIVLEVEVDDRTVWMATAGSQATWAHAGDTVQVFGRITEDMVAALRKSLAAV